MRPLVHRLSPEVAEQWRATLNLLENKLRDDPGNEHAWMWEIQWYIIAYLLGRYAGEEITRRPHPAKRIPRPVLPLNVPPPLPLDVKPSWIPTVPPGMGKAPRSLMEIRSRLETVKQGNQDRYHVLQQLRDQYLDELRRESEDMRQKYSGLKFVLITSRKLSEDEIVELLTNWMQENSGDLPPIEEKEEESPPS